MSNTIELQKNYKKDGYVLIKNFFSKDEIVKLITDIRETSDKKNRS